MPVCLSKLSGCLIFPFQESGIYNFSPIFTNKNQKINRFRETTNYKTFLYIIQHFIQKKSF